MKFRNCIVPRPLAGRNRLGFTLVELLVVIAIIALLVSMLTPNLSRMMELARRTQCATNLKGIGDGWQGYWPVYNYRQPNLFNPLPNCSDCISQFGFRIFSGSHPVYGGTTHIPPDYTNVGLLHKLKYVSDGQAFVCPTRERNFGGPWFNRTSEPIQFRNAMPPNSQNKTNMTYGTRRMLYYDDSSLAFEQHHYDPRDDHVMIWTAGLSGVPKPSGFSYMADYFGTPGGALQSHVPGVNILYLDGHVRFFRDATGKLLYDNGINGWGTEWNWLHDDIWMIIDGYHRLPVGSGNK